MEFRFNYPRIVEGCLGLLLVAAIGNSFMLTVGEGARLLVIIVGLGLLYLKYGQNDQEADINTATFRYGASILALILMFVLVQFDPLFARINELVVQEHMNWFFVLSTGAVLAGFLISIVGSFLAMPERKLKAWVLLVSNSWSSFDRIVLTTIIAIIVFMFLTGLVFPESASEIQTSGMLKLGLCLLVYFNVLAVYRLPGIDKTEDSRILIKRTIAGLKAAYKIVLSVFCLVVLLGAFKYVSARYEQEKGILFIEAGKYEEAVAVLGSALEKKSYHSEELNVALGHAYLGLGQDADARKYFALARRTEVNSQTVDKSIGDVYSSLGIWDTAILDYKEARGGNPDPLYVLDELSMAYLKNGERMRVIELIERYARIPTLQLNAVPDLVEFGICLIYTQHYDAATEQFKQALQLDVNSGIVYYGQGLLENKKREWEKASGLLEKALVLDSTLVSAHYELGVAYQNLDQIDRASDRFEKVLSQQPEHLLALGQLASLYAREGRLQLAEDMTQKMRFVVSPLEWRGRTGGNLAWAGSCWYETELFRGEIEITVLASGTPASDVWPIMEFLLDEKKIGSVSVVKEGTYTFETKVESSAYHKLEMMFPNDSSASEVGDRNLYVGQAKIRYLRVD